MTVPSARNRLNASQPLDQAPEKKRCFDPDSLVIGVSPPAGDFPHVLVGPRYSPHGQIATNDASELIADAPEPYPDRRGCERASAFSCRGRPDHRVL
jgi:hypothetical protein